ncbi:DUF6368 family protein [Streptomyces antibioticus]|uniref:DUF6368 family protein n=1 Tax=Streptomyces antibioticus TaxID=1890 RepID=UPI0033D88980
MSGPTLVIELAEPLSPSVLREFRALIVGLSSRFEEKRPGFFDITCPQSDWASRTGERRTGESRSRFHSLATPPRARSSRPWWDSIRSARTGVGPPGLLDGAGCRRREHLRG